VRYATLDIKPRVVQDAGPREHESDIFGSTQVIDGVGDRANRDASYVIHLWLSL